MGGDSTSSHTAHLVEWRPLTGWTGQLWWGGVQWEFNNQPKCEHQDVGACTVGIPCPRPQHPPASHSGSWGTCLGHSESPHAMCLARTAPVGGMGGVLQRPEVHSPNRRSAQAPQPPWGRPLSPALHSAGPRGRCSTHTSTGKYSVHRCAPGSVTVRTSLPRRSHHTTPGAGTGDSP